MTPRCWRCWPRCSSASASRAGRLQLNSVGCPNDRPRYNQALREALAGVKDRMCADCQRRAETNPLRVLDCKVPEDQPIIEKLPKISRLSRRGLPAALRRVARAPGRAGVPYTINERMVRGLDYYTRTTFEFTHGELGAQNAMLGGGRYDGLSEALGGPRAPGIGFAIGEDRLVHGLAGASCAAHASARRLHRSARRGHGPARPELARELRHRVDRRMWATRASG